MLNLKPITSNILPANIFSLLADEISYITDVERFLNGVRFVHSSKTIITPHK